MDYRQDFAKQQALVMLFISFAFISIPFFLEREDKTLKAFHITFYIECGTGTLRRVGHVLLVLLCEEHAWLDNEFLISGK